MGVSKELSELAGIIVGDGCISITDRYHELAIAGDLTEEKEFYENRVKFLLEKYFGKQINIKEYPSVGVCGVYLFDKRIVKELLNLGFVSGPKTNISIPSAVIQNKQNKIAFIRGLFDTDGSIYFDKNYSAKNKINNSPRIKLGSTSKKLISQVFEILVELGYHPTLKKPFKGKRDKNKMYSVLLYRKNDINKWLEEISFNNPKHQTKVVVWTLLGYCPPKTNIKERKQIIYNAGMPELGQTGRSF